jgi:hypothetical protein
MVEFLRRLLRGCSVIPPSGPSADWFNPLLIGVWAPVDGNPRETIEYRIDRTVRMALFGGLLAREGRYQFVQEDVVRIDWQDNPDPDGEAVLGAVNEQLAAQGHGIEVRPHQQTVLQIEVTQTELKTLHLEKQRTGHFRRANHSLTCKS